jgi:type I restriction enzyme S subunit
MEMRDGKIDVTRLRRTSRERAEKFKRATLKSGDILISKDGTIGKVSVVPAELEGGNITQHIVRVAIHPFLERDYVVWALRSPLCQAWLTGETKGVALQGVNVEDFRKLPIPVAPFFEQSRIVSRIEILLARASAIEVAAQATQEQLNSLDQTVLAKAFQGDLVERDPNDEPAKALLERLRARIEAPHPRSGLEMWGRTTELNPKNPG